MVVCADAQTSTRQLLDGIREAILPL